jgi:hypothetical protein
MALIAMIAGQETLLAAQQQALRLGLPHQAIRQVRGKPHTIVFFARRTTPLSFRVRTPANDGRTSGNGCQEGGQ